MGDAIARLLAAGFAVRVWNRTRRRTRAIVAAGAAAAQTPAEAVAEADVVLTMLTDGMPTSVIAPAGGGRSGDAARMRGSDGHYRPDLDNLLAAATATASRRRAGGGDQPARTGDLLVLASGRAPCAAWSHRCSTISRRTVWLGEAGAGAA